MTINDVWRWRLWRFAWAGREMRVMDEQMREHTGYPLRHAVIDGVTWRRLFARLWWRTSMPRRHPMWGKSPVQLSYAAWRAAQVANVSNIVSADPPTESN